jgi:type II secretory ATPase GspE/PulE/Tfp pilus assembly ATPase PilB-like protein
MSDRYHIRFRGRTAGPLSVEKLQSLAKRGRFGRHYEVSTDGRHWESAAEFPELFLDESGGGGGGGGGYGGGGFDDDELAEPMDGEDIAAPLIDPPGSGGRRKRKSRAERERPDMTMPLYDDPEFDDDALDDMPLDKELPKAGRRQRSRRQRAPTDGAVYDDSAAEYDLPPEEEDEAAGRSTSHRAPRRRSRRQPPPIEDDYGDFDDSAAAVEPPPKLASRRKRKQRQAEETEQRHPFELSESSEPELHDSQDEVDPVVEKSGGLWGMFRRKRAPEMEQAPHVLTLRRMSERLRPEKFSLEDITLVGTRHQKLSCVGNQGSGDGILTLGLLTLVAYQTGSTDIHLEPQADSYMARMRVDGMLIPIVELPKEVATRVAGVVKVLCEIDFTGLMSIQEGNYSSAAPGRQTDYRVSFTPSVHGQKLAIRVLDAATSLLTVNELGAPKSLCSKLETVMEQNAGMILMCGPTGSGKTTTLYSLLRGIDRKSRNVMTIEDPVEYQIEGVTQSSVDADRGKNFSDMLRALLRQDPDVLLLGEIRDQETAKISMQATMTGHLVLSTVHAKDTLNTVFRLLDLGADPNMVASSLDVVLAQRLVRLLCTHCAKRRRPTANEAKKMGRFARDMVYESAGCDRCLGTGFSGRRALFELLSIDERMKDIMLKSPTLGQLRESVKGQGFVTLRQHGYQVVAQGLTTLGEIDRVIGMG